ncbi:MAG: hypothetical protein NTW95_14700 [Candidatus Aminicenantes bacterium]|nr:hypothetical protein [Candidatus Aminicenantes bacterium]
MKNVGMMASRRVSCIAVLAAAILNAGCASALRSRNDISGRYSHPGGWGITIRSDGTFTRQDPPSLGTPLEVQGRWKFVDNQGLIVVNTFQQPDRYPIRLSCSDKHNDLQVKVENLMNGMPLKEIKVQMNCWHGLEGNDCPSMEQSALTDENGIAILPRCLCQTRMLYVFMDPTKTISAFWEIRDPKANEITVKVDPMVSDFITDQFWLVRGGKLYIFYDSFPLKRTGDAEDD